MDEGPESAAPTELAGVAEADTMSSYAWSEDDASLEVEPQSDRPFWVTTAAVAVSAGLVTAAAVLGFRYVTDEVPSRPVAVSAPATTTAAPTPVATAPVSPLPPPPPVTVTTVVVQSTIQAPAPQAAPAAPPLPVWNQALDAQFVDTLRSRGFVVWDPISLTGQAHNICMTLSRGVSSPQGVINELSAPGSPTSPLEARVFVTTIMQTYPNCP